MRILGYLILKMWQNRAYTLSTLLGLTVAAAFAMSVPMYADGTLKRLVAKSLEGQTKGLPAASLYVKYQPGAAKDTDLESLGELDDWMAGELPGRIGFPADAYSGRMNLPASTVRTAEPGTGSASRIVRMELAAQSGDFDRLDVVQGKPPRDGLQDGAVEALVLDETLRRHGWAIGDRLIYDAVDADGKKSRLIVLLAGTYRLKDEADASWAIDGKDKLADSLLVSRKTMTEHLLGESRLALDSAGWYYAFDLSDIRIGDLPSLIGELQRLDIQLSRMLEHTKVNLSFVDMLHDFNRQSLLLQAMLFALAAPVLAMVLYFVAMNAKQALDRQRADIAVLHSRGASPRQIVTLYFIEAVLLGAAALLLGIGLAWFMAKTIGASNGFLEFVGRKSIPVGRNGVVWLFGCLATAAAIVATAAPVRAYAEASVVKHALRGKGGKPLWQRVYADVALLAAAAAGWYLMASGRISTGGADGEGIEPAIFVLPTLFLFASGLLILRLFPLLLRLWNTLTGRRMPVTIHLTMTQLSRSAEGFHPIMILLILTIGLGVYNASAARTMDVNATDRAHYQYGSDVVLTAAWEGVQDENDANRIYYNEPSYEAYLNLDGVEAYARVMRTTGKASIGGKAAGTAQLVGIDNADFAETARFREDLYPIHPYHYLDALGQAEQAALVSAGFAERYGVKEGDPLTVSVGYGSEPVDLVVVGIVPYWPSLYPDESPFIVANLEYVYMQVDKIPYEVWLKMESGAKLAPVLETLTQRDIALVRAEDVRGELAERRQHPAQGGVFGILSLGFLISLLVSFLGFVIFWFFTLSRRVVQLGVLRAMGLSRGQLARMLLLEQLLTTGLSVLAGGGLGMLAGRLFLPFLQGGAAAGAREVPPLRIVFESGDTAKLAAAVGMMLAAGACLFILQLRRLRIAQAVKLGEER
ncbi:ABC transporter permease [Cohnella hongkongensis]|uniref:ABC transporter permease n=1 Tax=Cohnella hongkongensis TaxID=178337 RepID=A0ABV9FDZ6_9BACL